MTYLDLAEGGYKTIINLHLNVLLQNYTDTLTSRRMYTHLLKWPILLYKQLFLTHFDLTEECILTKLFVVKGISNMRLTSQKLYTLRGYQT